MYDERVSVLCAISVKNHCKASVLCVFLLTTFRDRYVNSVMTRLNPSIVTISGRLFINLGTIRVLGLNTKLEKNHPASIVPAASRKSAFPKFIFSSSIGESEDTVGDEKKHSKIIRNL